MFMKYIHIHYLTGASGNFLGRALSLCDRAYFSTTQIGLTLAEKLELLSYRTVANREFAITTKTHWPKFESLVPIIPLNHGLRLTHDECSELDELPDDALIIRVGHPATIAHNRLHHNDDDHTIVAIANTNQRRVTANFHYKCHDATHKAPLNQDWINGQNQVLGESTTNIVTSEDFDTFESFINMIKRLLSLADIPLSRLQQNAIHTLYNEWYDSTLMTDAEIDAFENYLASQDK